MNAHKNILFFSLALLSTSYIFLFLFEVLLTDSPAYLYIGSQMNIGKVPYLDLFDHKGPLLYVINVIPFLISNSWKFIYILEGVSIIFVSMLIFNISSKILNNSYGYLITSSFIISFLLVFSGGNLPETYTLIILSISYMGALNYFINEENGIKSIKQLKILFVLLGISIGAISLIKISNIAGICLLSAYLAFQKRSFQLCLFAFLGFCLVCMPTLIWLYINSALQEFINQYILFNFSYIENVNFEERRINLAILLLNFSALPTIIFLAAFSLIIGIRNVFNRIDKLTVIFIVILGVDIISQTISGMQSAQYILITIPSSIALTILIFKNNFNESSIALINKGKILMYIFFAIVFLSLFRIIDDFKGYSSYSLANESRSKQINYLTSLSSLENSIVINTSESWLYLQANKISSSRFFSDLGPRSNFLNTKEEYINSIIKNKPSIIITNKCNNPPPYKCYPILGEALNSFYKKDKIIEDLEFWRLD